MIISHNHRYLFIQIPHTASTAIGRELCEMYDGVRILHKHAHYLEFERVASPEERKYFVFAGIRNPMDIAVTKYFKYKTNHKSQFTDPGNLLEHGGHISNEHLRHFHFIQGTGADFATYFEKFYRWPYSNMLSVSQQYCDFIIRFERLQDDFSTALKLIGIKQERSLPEANPTNQKKGDFLQYYTPAVRGQARRVFGPFMRKWEYDFPPELGDYSVSWFNQLEFRIIECIKNFVWKYIKGSPGFYGRLFRKLW
jgi:hypothetical protein